MILRATERDMYKLMDYKETCLIRAGICIGGACICTVLLACIGISWEPLYLVVLLSGTAICLFWEAIEANDRIMQTKNTAKVSNGDLGFIRYIKDDEDGKRIGLDFGVGRELEYSVEDMVNLDLAYATTIHKAMGSEYETVIMPLLKAHTVMLYRNLLYTGITRAKKRVVLIGQKQVLFMAIHRNEIVKRNTLLGTRIGMYYKAYAKRAGIPVPAALEEELKYAG